MAIPAQAYDWDIQKQVEVAKLGQDFVGYFAWHYPPPFLFVASLLAQFPYPVAFIGWVVVSFVPYLVAMRAIVGRNFGYLLALAIPMAFINALVGQNGFLTAALIGGTLYLIPVRPILAGICLGLLTLQAAIRAAVSDRADRGRALARVLQRRRNAVVLAFASWLAFGIESWQAFFHWMPMFSQAFLTEGKATMVEAAEHLLAGALFRRHRAAWLGIPVGSDRLGRRGAGADVAQPRALHVEGRSARRRHAC